MSDGADRQNLLGLLTRIGRWSGAAIALCMGFGWERSEPALLRASSAKAPHDFEEHFDHKLIRIASLDRGVELSVHSLVGKLRLTTSSSGDSATRIIRG